MLSAAAVALRAGARPSASRALSQSLARASAPASIQSLSRGFSTSHALAAASYLPADRTREIVAQTVSSIGSKREG